MLYRKIRTLLRVKEKQESDLKYCKANEVFEPIFVITIDDNAALIYGEIRAELAGKGTIIGPYDLQIAVIALANDLTLITHNTREFGRISSLIIEDWEI